MLALLLYQFSCSRCFADTKHCSILRSSAVVQVSKGCGSRGCKHVGMCSSTSHSVHIEVQRHRHQLQSTRSDAGACLRITTIRRAVPCHAGDRN
eukprot:6189576-Pleurochrysis_carterae.AAC.2